MPRQFATLSVDDVLRIYEQLVKDFAESGDPFGQMGLRSQGLLESAVNRQHTGQRDILKYSEPLAARGRSVHDDVNAYAGGSPEILQGRGVSTRRNDRNTIQSR